MAQSISGDYYRMIASAKESIDIKVKSPWPGQIKRREELREFMEPEHILVSRAKAGIACRLICLEPESYQNFFAAPGSRMGHNAHCEEVQGMLREFQNAGGKTRFIEDAMNPEISFVVADKVRAFMFLGTWLGHGSETFKQTALLTEDPETIRFLLEAFELCWNSR